MDLLYISKCKIMISKTSHTTNHAADIIKSLKPDHHRRPDLIKLTLKIKTSHDTVIKASITQVHASNTNRNMISHDKVSTAAGCSWDCYYCHSSTSPHMQPHHTTPHMQPHHTSPHLTCSHTTPHLNRAPENLKLAGN